MALVSGVFLNSWVVYHVYDGFRRRWPQHLISRRESQEVVVVVALAGILIVSLLTAYLCYKGLENPNRLPNWETVVSAAIALLGPVVFSFIFSRRAQARA
jgi:Na+/proline symporter